jgi:hypothetical protein
VRTCCIDAIRSGGFPLIQAVPDLGQVPWQPLVHPSDRMIGDAFEGLSGMSGIHPRTNPLSREGSVGTGAFLALTVSG